MKKLKNNRGESLVEVLVATVIISLCFIILAGAIVSSAKVNKKTRDLDADFKKSNDSFMMQVKIIHEDHDITNVDNVGHETDNGYYYYEAME